MVRGLTPPALTRPPRRRAYRPGLPLKPAERKPEIALVGAKQIPITDINGWASAVKAGGLSGYQVTQSLDNWIIATGVKPSQLTYRKKRDKGWLSSMVGNLTPELRTWYDEQKALSDKQETEWKAEYRRVLKQLEPDLKWVSQRARLYDENRAVIAAYPKDHAKRLRYRQKMLKASRPSPKVVVTGSPITVNVYEISTQRGPKKFEAVNEEQAKRKAEAFGLTVKEVKKVGDTELTPSQAYERIQTAEKKSKLQGAEAAITYGKAFGEDYEIPEDSVPVNLGVGVGAGFLSPEMIEGLKELPFYDDKGKGTEQEKLSRCAQNFSALETITLPNGNKVLKRSVTNKAGDVVALGWEDIPDEYRQIGREVGVDAMYAQMKADAEDVQEITTKLEEHKTEVEGEEGYDLLSARAANITPVELLKVGFSAESVRWADDAYQASQETGIALPGEKEWVTIRDSKTGNYLPPDQWKHVTDLEYKALMADWDEKRRAFLKGKTLTPGVLDKLYETIGRSPRQTMALTPASFKRKTIEGFSSIFFVPTKALLPEVTIKDIRPIEWAIGGAQIAAWSIPFVPKAILPIVSGGAAGIIGYVTVKNWRNMTTGQKALAVAGTVLISLPVLSRIGATKLIPRPAAVKVPGAKGTEITVWRGFHVNGKPIFGISSSKPTLATWGIRRPTIAQIEAGWHPVTRIETTLLGTRRALKQMGVSADDIAKVEAVWKEGVPVFLRKKPPTSVVPEEMLSGSQRLTPQEVGAILKVSIQKWAKKIRMIYGSSTMRPQLKKVLRDWRKWHDIDIQTNMTATEVAAYTDDIIRELKKLGTRARVDPKQPGVVQKWADGQWVKVTDIHALDVLPDSPIVAEGAYGYLYAESPIRIKLPGVGKLRIMTLSETGLRKAGSVTSFQIDKIAPAAHRANDIADLYIIVLNYKGASVAERVAKAFGFTGKELLKIAEKNPHRWAMWTLSPSPTPGTGFPSVAIYIPATLAASMSASLSAELRSYSPIVSPATSSYIMRASPYSVRSVGPSGKLSPSLISSPSLKPSSSPSVIKSSSAISSISYSPSVSPRSYPPSRPSSAPSYAPPSYPPSYPPSAPTKPPSYPLLVLTAGGEKRYKLPKGSWTWKQGLFWKYIPPPWTQDKPITLDHPPVGAKHLGEKTPEKTIQMIGKPRAKVPKDASIDLGVVDIKISDYGKRIEFVGKGLETVVGHSLTSPTKGMSVPAKGAIEVSGYAKLAFGTDLTSLVAETYKKTIPKKFADKVLGQKLGKLSAKQIAKELKETKVSLERRAEILKMLPDRVRKQVELWESMVNDYAPTRGMPKAKTVPTIFRRKKKPEKAVVKTVSVG